MEQLMSFDKCAHPRGLHCNKNAYFLHPQMISPPPLQSVLCCRAAASGSYIVSPFLHCHINSHAPCGLSCLPSLAWHHAVGIQRHCCMYQCIHFYFWYYSTVAKAHICEYVSISLTTHQLMKLYFLLLEIKPLFACVFF